MKERKRKRNSGKTAHGSLRTLKTTRESNTTALADGLIIEDVSDANSLNSLRFEVDQYSSGEDLEALLAN